MEIQPTIDDIFGDYDEWKDRVKLVDLAANRGLIEKTPQRALRALKELDNNIDRRNYHDLTYQGLHRLAVMRGFDPRFLPSIKNNTKGNKENLRRKLERYDKGTLSDGFLTEEGVKRYQYAIRRNKHYAEQVPKPHLGSPQLLSREDLEKMSDDEIRSWLNNNGYNIKGVHHRGDLIATVLAAQKDFIKAQQDRVDLGLVLKVDKDLDEAINRALKVTPTSLEYLYGILITREFTDWELYSLIETKACFIPHGDLFSTTPIEYIMRSKDGPRLADGVIRKFLLDRVLPPTSNFVDKINLLWKLYAIENNYEISKTTRQLLTEYTLPEIRRMFKQLANLDDVTIIALLYLGVKPPEVTYNEVALETFKILTPTEVVKIVRYLYLRPEQRDYPKVGLNIPLLSYYEEFLTIRPSITILPFLNWKEGTDPTEVAFNVGMIIPPHIKDVKGKIEYFLNNLPYYDYVLERPEELDPLPYLEDVPHDEIRQLLLPYTDDELIDAYELDFDIWYNRNNFIGKIITEAKGEPKWSFKKKYCNNLNRIDVEEGDLLNVDDPHNPVISYGTLSDYRCYLISELVYFFRDDKELGFIFGVPDWVASTINVDYPKPNFREFPLNSIKQLKRLLDQPKYQDNPDLDELREKIKQGLIAKSNVEKYLGELRQKYLSFPKDWQEQVQEYLFQLFILTMYMRFWKGPGYPYPTQWIEEGLGPYRCGPSQRETNTNQQFVEIEKTLEKMDKNLRDWLLSFPRFRYDFRTGTIAMGQEKIEAILQDAKRGQFCLAEVSDQLLGTCYLLILRILNLGNDDFNRYLKEKMLNRPDQPDFKPEEITQTGHVDPFHNLQDIDD